MNYIEVLVADDSPLIVKLINKALLENKNSKYRFQKSKIYNAHDGLEAFELLSYHKNIKLIISDINMPGLNGDEILEILIDTEKLQDIEVVFVTTQNIANEISHFSKKHILGTILKPFNVDSFNKELNALHVEQEEKIRLHKKNMQFQEFQKRNLSLIITEYLSQIKDIKPSEIDLKAFIEPMFCEDDTIAASELELIAITILNSIFEEKSIEHDVDIKMLKCLFNKTSSLSTFEIDSFGLFQTYEDAMNKIFDEITSSNEISSSKILQTLGGSLQSKLAKIQKNLQGYPRYNYKLFYPYFTKIVIKLEKIDCNFISDDLQKELSHLSNLYSFMKFINSLLKENKIQEELPFIDQFQTLQNDLLTRFKKYISYMQLFLDQYCAKIESLLYNRAKKSNDIVKYFKKNLPHLLMNTKNYAYYLNLIDQKNLKFYLPYEKEQLIMISNSVENMKELKDTISQEYKNWQLYGYSKVNMIDTYFLKRIPTKIVIDYSYRCNGFENAVEYLKHIQKIYPNSHQAFRTSQIYIIIKYSDFDKIEDLSFNYKTIEAPFQIKKMVDALLY